MTLTQFNEHFSVFILVNISIAFHSHYHLLLQIHSLLGFQGTAAHCFSPISMAFTLKSFVRFHFVFFCFILIFIKVMSCRALTNSSTKLIMKKITASDSTLDFLFLLFNVFALVFICLFLNSMLFPGFFIFDISFDFQLKKMSI